MLKVKPLKDFVLVRQIKQKESQTASGIYVPEPVHDIGRNDGVVESVGPEVRDVKVGDVVLWDNDLKLKVKTKVLKHERETYLFIKEENIAGIVEE